MSIVAVYDGLAQVAPSPVELNRAVAVGMAFGPAQALGLVDQLADEAGRFERLQDPDRLRPRWRRSLLACGRLRNPPRCGAVRHGSGDEAAGG